MKKYITLCLLALSTVLVSCTKEDEESMAGPSISPSNLKFTVTQQPGHDNVVMLNSQTEGSYIPFWEFTGGFSKRKMDTINLPFAGDYTIRYTLYTQGGPVADSTNITVSENDREYFASPLWSLLTNEQEGKTWVWASDIPGGICHGNGSGEATAPEWWQNGIGYLTEQGVQADEMTFDLNGAKNYTLSHGGNARKALFELDTANRTLKIIGSDISLGNKVTYVIVKLTANELTLAQQGDGWRNIWMYKRKGFNY
ncbi:hypothetical protein [Chitinophaga rhizophila]|uniref:PKD domain-containing protein n=1 Tax=Chitinophaga rhizophila TaxID=2866212 RepID=A0ABS7GIP0_9BACT|nr:hypothetical protein [Chitinophaga rhizophila]MBW8687565.1 hypothetical protein [Chitinophaga rhizophila]